MSDIRKIARTFMPFRGTRDEHGNPQLSPPTQRSVIPSNNVYTIQDIVFDGRKYVMPGGGGSWSSGENAQEPSYRAKGTDYKLQEEYLSNLRMYRDQVMLNNFLDHTPMPEVWSVVQEGGTRLYPTFPLAQSHKEKLREKGIYDVFISKIAQIESSQPMGRAAVIAESINKCFMVEAIDKVSGSGETGSAFCIRPNLFLTCAHVIRKYDKTNISDPHSVSKHAQGINIRLIQNGRMYNGEVVAVDLLNDIALIQSDASEDYLELDSDFFLGDDIISIGSPHGYENNVSAGILSAVGKRLYFYEGAPEYLFVDLSVFPGNSGGPVIKASNGKIVGLITLIVSESGTYGLNAALPLEKIVDFCKVNIEGF